MGDDYGPIVVAQGETPVDQLHDMTIAVPGTLTTAFLALSLRLGKKFDYVLVPFDQILEAVAAGEFEGKKVDAGLVIHEGQLTFQDAQLNLVVDLGKWWKEDTGLPLPLGANAIRRDLGQPTINDVTRLLYESIKYGLDHRQDGRNLGAAVRSPDDHRGRS